MSNLVPTPRVNKNGHTVIKHMRPDTGNPSALAHVPAPQAYSSDHHRISHMIEQLKERMAVVYERNGYEFTSMAIPFTLNERLELKNNYVVEAYFDYIMEDPDNDREQLLMSMLTNYLDDEDAMNLLFIAQTLGVRDGSSWDEAREGSMDFVYAWEMYRGFDEYDGFEVPDDIINASDEEKASIRSVVKMIDAVYHTDSRYIMHEGFSTDGYFLVGDDNLVQLAAQRPDDADAIVKIITERKLMDPKDITAILDANVVPALSEGAL